MSDDHQDFRRIGIAVLLMLALAVLAIGFRDAGHRWVGQLLMAGCIVSFGFTLTVFSRFLRRHGNRIDNDQGPD
jgi:uncharacterized membrane protein